MRRPAKKRPLFEGLESRAVPTVSAALAAGSLLVTGSATVPGEQIRIVGSSNLTAVYDGANTVGAYAVTKDLSVQLGDTGNNLLIDYTLGRTIGNLTVALGNGTNSAVINGGRASAATITGGIGNDSVTMSSFQVDNLTSVDLGSGADSFTLGSKMNLHDLNVLNAEAVDLALASIGNNATITNLSNPSTVSTGATINGTLTVREVGGTLNLGGNVKSVLYGNSPAPVIGSNLNVTGRVGGTLSYSGTPFSDTATFAPGSNVGQDVTISLYGGDDSASFSGSIGNGHTSIMQLDMGDGNDAVAVTGTAQMVSGSTYIWLGAGDDLFTVADTAVFLSGRVDGGAGTDTYVGNPTRPDLLILNMETFQ